MATLEVDEVMAEDGGRGPWFQSYTGKAIHVLDPREEDIDIVDIAHSLSLVNRFGGHTACCDEAGRPCGYNVGQHSYMVGMIVERTHPELSLAGHLHDSSEAYLGDVIRPLKLVLPGYKEIEKKWERIIGRRFGLGDLLTEMPDVIKRADNVMLATERRDLLSDGPGHRRWTLHETPLPEKLVPWSAQESEVRFLERFKQLWGQAHRKW